MADAQVALRHVALDDKYDLTKDRVFITGTQAIVRLLLMQRERDRLAGLKTAGVVFGYRRAPRSSPATAARRLVGSTRTSGARKNGWRRRLSSSSPASTKNLPPPPCGAA